MKPEVAVIINFLSEKKVLPASFGKNVSNPLKEKPEQMYENLSLLFLKSQP